MYCSKCGSQVDGGTAFCPACGQPTGSITPAGSAGVVGGATASQPASSPPTNYPIAPQILAPVVYGQPTVQYAGFWLRVVAYLIDGLVMGVAFAALVIPFFVLTGLGAALGNIHPGSEPRDFDQLIGGTFFLGLITIIGLGIIGGWLYHAKMESSAWQATLGKKALSLRVTDLYGARVTFNRATGRHFAKLMTGLIPLGVGFMLAGFTERRQALHDIIASCLVLRDN